MLSPWSWSQLAQTALQEDIGFADLTTFATVPADRAGRLAFVAREPLSVCGLPGVTAVYALLDALVRVEPRAAEGDRVSPGAVIATLSGPARALLTGERVALNIIQHLSGVATATRQVVDLVEDLGVDVLDTRKTTPGLRSFQKYAVATGGGKNHRFGLDHAVLIKDNHIEAAGGISPAIRRAKESVGPNIWIEVEVDRVDQIDEVLAETPHAILLDNMGPADLREAVAKIGGRAYIEASGGIRPDTVREIAKTGVNAVSLGWVTHSSRAVDIGADWA